MQIKFRVHKIEDKNHLTKLLQIKTRLIIQAGIEVSGQGKFDSKTRQNLDL